VVAPGALYFPSVTNATPICDNLTMSFPQRDVTLRFPPQEKT
jgi:hypothetical protein